MFRNFVWPYFLISGLVLTDLLLTEFFRKPLVIVWVAYALLPILDQILPEDHYNPSIEEQAELKKQAKWKVPLGMYFVVDWLYQIWMIKTVVSGEFSLLLTLCIVLGAGNVSGVGLVAAHEVFHKKDITHRVLGTLHMSKSLYMHFFIEHLYGHHKNVATPYDAATSRLGEKLYTFIPRSVFHTFLNTWDYEAKRLGSGWSIYNRHFLFGAVELALVLGVYKFFGFLGLAAFFAQAVISICLLETTNYIEHYGLERKEVSPGVYEPVTIKHSWNAPQVFQNVILFKLQRHSDHHENSLKPYQTLCSYEESPKLPCGYAVCVTAAAVPQVWFSIVDPLVLIANKKGVISEQELQKGTLVLKSFVYLQAMILTTALVLI
mmetsp:Transcript_15708/g.28682  ORF Transcript_15708/g.28682 Transcript_15708/m.28682 type:complete len:377 (-) Transcript_15708:848-1978(-)